MAFEVVHLDALDGDVEVELTEDDLAEGDAGGGEGFGRAFGAARGLAVGTHGVEDVGHGTEFLDAGLEEVFASLLRTHDLADAWAEVEHHSSSGLGIGGAGLIESCGDAGDVLADKGLGLGEFLLGKPDEAGLVTGPVGLGIGARIIGARARASPGLADGIEGGAGIGAGVESGDGAFEVEGIGAGALEAVDQVLSDLGGIEGLAGALVGAVRSRGVGLTQREGRGEEERGEGEGHELSPSRRIRSAMGSSGEPPRPRISRRSTSLASQSQRTARCSASVEAARAGVPEPGTKEAR